MAKHVKLKMLKPLLKTIDTRVVKPSPKKADPFYHSTEWRKLMAEIYKERGRSCQECGETDPKMYGDHIIELQDGGAPLDPENVRVLCASCHMSKTMAARARRMGERYL